MTYIATNLRIALSSTIPSSSILKNLSLKIRLMTVMMNSIMGIPTKEMLMSYLVIQGSCLTRIMIQKSLFMRMPCLISFDQTPRSNPKGDPISHTH